MNYKNRLEKLEQQTGAQDAPPIICEWNYSTREEFLAALEAQRLAYPNFTGLRAISVDKNAGRQDE